MLCKNSMMAYFTIVSRVGGSNVSYPHLNSCVNNFELLWVTPLKELWIIKISVCNCFLQSYLLFKLI